MQVSLIAFCRVSIKLNHLNYIIMKFKIIKKGKPGVVGGGEKKYYASPVYSGELDLDELTARIEKISTVSGADVRAVL